MPVPAGFFDSPLERRAREDFERERNKGLKAAEPLIPSILGSQRGEPQGPLADLARGFSGPGLALGQQSLAFGGQMPTDEAAMLRQGGLGAQGFFAQGPEALAGASQLAPALQATETTPGQFTGALTEAQTFGPTPIGALDILNDVFGEAEAQAAPIRLRQPQIGTPEQREQSLLQGDVGQRDILAKERVAANNGISVQELDAILAQGDIQALQFQSQLDNEITGVVREAFPEEPAIGGVLPPPLLRAGTFSPLGGPPGSGSTLENLEKIPFAGGPLSRSVGFLTSPLGLLTAGAAGIPLTAAGEVGAVALGTAAEALDAPPAVQLGAEIAGGLATPGAFTAPVRQAARQGQRALRRAPQEIAEAATETPSRVVSDAEDLVPRGTIDTDAPPIRQRPAIVGGAEAFAAPLRPIEETLSEVVTSDNSVVRALVGRTGINPSVLKDTELGRATVAFWRQKIAGEQLTEVAVAAAVDARAQRVTGRTGAVLNRDSQGFIQNVTPRREGASLQWNDVYSRPDDYNLSSLQRGEIDDYLRTVQEVEFLRVQAGLKPRALTGKEGWFYVPRQVKGVRGVELRRPSSPNLQRHFEEAQEGVAKGIDYENPRNTLELHVRQAYNEIAQKQFDDLLQKLEAEAVQRGERLFVTPTELLPESVMKQMSDATLGRLSAERNLRSLRAEMQSLQVGGTGLRGEEAAAQQTLRTARQGQRGQLRGQIQTAKAELETARTKFTTAKNRRARALESARRSEIAKGNIFGEAEETIPIAQWRNRFFRREDAGTLREGIDEFFNPAKQNPFATGAIETGNVIRFLSAVGDFAAPFIQGLPVLATNPRRWGRATLAHYQAFLDPTVQARFIRENLESFQEMAAHGTPVGDPEFFAALRPGQGISPGALLEGLPKGPEARRLLQQGGRQTFGRFQASYDTFLGSARAQMTDALRTTIPDAAERQAFIRNLTGGLDSRALGVKAPQRAFEGFALAFSPRLVRSTIALVGDLRLGLRSARGRQAWRSLSQLAAGTTGLYVAAGLGMGKNWEEIQTGLNPLEGKKFLSYQINGDWIGVGGQIRAITQLLARTAADPSSLGELDQFDNPLIAAFTSRGAPAIGLVGGAIEATTGANALPFDKIDSPPDFFKHVGKSALPFAVQGILEGENPLSTVFGLGGARTSAETRTEELQRRTGVEDPGTARLLARQDPELADLVPTSEGTLKVREALAEDLETGADIARDFLSGNTQAGAGYRQWRSDVLTKSRGAFDVVFAGTEFPGPDTDEGKKLQAVRDLSPDDFRDAETQEIDWDAFNEAQAALLAELTPPVLDAYNSAIAQVLSGDPQIAEVERQYQEAQDIRDQLPSPVNGLHADDYREVRSFLSDVQDTRRQWTVETGDPGQLEPAIIELGRQAGKEQPFIEWAVVLRGGIPDRFRSLEYDQALFRPEAQKLLQAFFPELFSSQRLAELQFEASQVR